MLTFTAQHECAFTKFLYCASQQRDRILIILLQLVW